MIKNVHLARRWLIALLASVLVSGTAITLAAQGSLASLTGSAGSGYEPLTSAEQDRALQSLRTTGVSTQNLRLPSAADATDSQATDSMSPAPAEEVLLVERHQEGKETYALGHWPRRADVYIYRYADNVLIRQVYNLDTNQVEQVDQMQGTQLPLTEAETQRAMAIAMADVNTRPLLNAEFQSITQQPLLSADQLIVKAMAFHADSAPGQDLGNAAQCGIRRCAQLLLTAGDNVALQVIPVVDLSSGAVVKALPFNGAPQ
jgi:hypothetical protein